MRTYYFTHLFAILSFSASVHAEIEFQSVVQAQKPKASKDAILVKTEQEAHTAAYPWMSLTRAGLNAVPNSGALSFGSIRYRGFSSPQLRVLVSGYDLNDTGTGIFDAYDLPLFASEGFELNPGVSDSTMGASIKADLVVPKDFMARSRATFGSSHFGMLDVVAASGPIGSSHALMGLQLGSTRGDFAYSDAEVRQNNDHNRIMGFLKTKHAFKNADLELFLLGRHHEGGLAGSIYFPPLDLRLSSQKLLFGSSLFWEFGSYPLSLKWQTRFDRLKTTESLRENSLSFIDNALSLRLEKSYKWADTSAFLESSISESQVLDGRFRRLSTHHEAGVNTSPFSFWSMRFRRSLSITAHSDAGWYFGFATNISAKPIEGLTLGFKFGKAGRPPTLSEMYGPSGLIAGNPSLEPEKIYDTGLYSNLEVNEKLSLNLDLYYSHMSKAILYLNNNGRYEPINVDHSHRASTSLAMRFTPSTFFESQARVDWVWTKVKATNSPYPGATPLAITIDGRAGKESGIFGRLSTVLNAGSYSDLYAKEYVSPYVLVNASLHVPLLEHARLNFALTNIANVTWAQSTYGFPIPGREFFISLELFS